MTGFLQAMAPGFRVRSEGPDSRGRPWRHVGNNDFYIAQQKVSSGEARTPYGNTPSMNYLGWEVDSVDEVYATWFDERFPASNGLAHGAQVEVECIAAQHVD